MTVLHILLRPGSRVAFWDISFSLSFLVFQGFFFITESDSFYILQRKHFNFLLVEPQGRPEIRQIHQLSFIYALACFCWILSGPKIDLLNIFINQVYQNNLQVSLMKTKILKDEKRRRLNKMLLWWAFLVRDAGVWRCSVKKTPLNILQNS